jgi:uncharacterized protein (TIGR03084 family)
MDEILAALAEQHAELYGLVAGLDEAQWQRPSRCEGWSVADVVLHLSQTDQLAVGSASGRFSDALGTLAHGIGPAGSVDDGADLMVARDRGQPGSSVLERWKTGADHLRSLLSTTDPHARVVWVAGELSARTLATTRLAECWIHTGDIAEALDTTLVPGDRLRHIARLAWRTLPYAFARSGRELTGPVAFELEGPHGDPWLFVPDEPPLTTITGPALDLCLVAARRVDPTATALVADGPDAQAVLDLVRTYA